MRTDPKILGVVLALACLAMIACAGPRPVGGAPRTLGKDVVVGSFTIHVQIQRRRVEVTERQGVHAAAVPSTQLDAIFKDWDAKSGAVSISVAVRNIGPETLFGPLPAVVLKIAPPDVVVANSDSGGRPGSWRWIYDASSLRGSILPPKHVSAAKKWNFTVSRAEDFQLDMEVLAGVPLPPGKGATIEGPGGTSITVQPGSIPYGVLIDIRPVPASDVRAPLGALAFVGAVDVTFQPVPLSSTLVPPTAPLEISIRAPTTLRTERFIVGLQVLIDSLKPRPGLREQLVPIATASFSKGNIVTTKSIFPGILGGGLFVFLANTGSGFVAGGVSDSTGVRSGVVVSNNTNTLVSITNGAGQYALFISGNSFDVTAFDPFRGSSGTATGSIGMFGMTATVDIFLTPLTAASNPRDGISNGGFELGCLPGEVECVLTGYWTSTGGATVRKQLGPTSTGVTIVPTEGDWMADIRTGADAVAGVGSALKQVFTVPAGVRTLRLDYNFVSEEFPEFVGSIFDDAFRVLVTIINPPGQITLPPVSVNQATGITLIGDCGFPGGDSTCGHTGWREASVDLSAYVGMTIMVELLFTAVDAGDNIYDTHVLIDNIRFSTLWIDVKKISGATANDSHVQTQLQVARDILSQAGINVRLRRYLEIADPGGLLVTDVTWMFDPVTMKGVPTGEETQLLSIGLSGTQPTDMNIYYTSSLTGGALAVAIGPDDFNNPPNSGIIMSDSVLSMPETLAHEIGHLLISPATAGSSLEHGVSDSTNFMRPDHMVMSTILSRPQSENINRAVPPSPSVPFLVP